MQNHNSIIESLSRSQLYQDYERAFMNATGLPLALHPLEPWELPYHGKGENPFCSLMARSRQACAASLQTQGKLSRAARHASCSVVSQTGLCETAVPVRVGDEVVGFLQTGQIFRRVPTGTQFKRVAKLATAWGVTADPATLESAYFKTRVLTKKEHESLIQLLKIFALHLSMASNQILVQQQTSEPPVIAQAKEFIRQHIREDFSLLAVAQAVKASTFHLCKIFKKTTGLNFTEYVSRMRVENAKNLLLNPNLRISEIAFEVGFQSLTHFNRVFRRFSGSSPGEYRDQVRRT